MLQKTISAIKADKAKSLDQINAGENGFLQGDIYPFCFNLSDGKLVAVAISHRLRVLHPKRRHRPAKPSAAAIGAGFFQARASVADA